MPGLPPDIAERLKPVNDPFINAGKRALTGLGVGVATTVPNIYQGADMLANAISGHQDTLPAVGAVRDFSQWAEDKVRGFTGVPPPVNTSERLTELGGALALPLGEVGPIAGMALPLRQSTTLGGFAVEAGLPALLGEWLGHQAGQSSIFGPEQAQAAPGVYQPPKQEQQTAPGVYVPDQPVATPAPGVYHPPADVVEGTAPGVYDPVQAQLDTRSRWMQGALGALVVTGVISGGATALKNARIKKKLNAVRTATEFGNNPQLEPRQINEPDPGMGTTTTLKGPIVDSWGRKVFTQSADNLAPLEEALRQSVAAGVLPQDRFDRLMARVRTTQHAGISAAINDFYKTGNVPGSSYKTSRPPVDLLSEIARLPVEKQAAYESMRTLGTKVDTLTRQWNEGLTQVAAGTLTMPRLIRKTTWGGLTLSQLQAKLTLLRRAHPDVLKLSDETQELFNIFPRYLRDRGLIDDASMNRMLTDNPNYHPLTRQELYRTTTKLKNAIWPTSLTAKGNKGLGVDLERLLKRQDPLVHSTEGPLKPEEIGSAIYAIPEYVNDVIRYGMVNQLRLDIAKELSRFSVVYDGVRQPLGKLTANPPTGNSRDGTIKIYDKGKIRHFTSIDDGVYNSMRWAPLGMAPISGPIAQKATSFLTGPYNPLFWLFKGPMYEAWTAAFSRPENMAMGPVTRTLNHIPVLSQILKSQVGQLVEGPLTTPIALAESIGGLPKAVWANMLDNAARATEAYSQAHPWSSNAKMMTQILRDAYERTSVSLMEASGAKSVPRYAGIDFGQAIAALDRIPGFTEGMGGHSRNNMLYRTYMGTFEAVKNMTRLQFFGANIKRELKWKTYTMNWRGGGVDMHVPVFEPVDPRTSNARLAALTNDLTGDMNRIGGQTTTAWGKGTQGILSSVPYANQFIQAGMSYARAFQDHPVRMMSSLTALAVAVQQSWLAVASTEQGKELVNQMTPEQRGRYIPITDATGLLHAFIAIPPELRLLASPVATATLAGVGALKTPFVPRLNPDGTPNPMYGHEYEGSSDVADAMWRTLVSDVFPDLAGTPMANLFLGAMGLDLYGPNTMEPKAPQRDVYTNALSADESATMGQRFKLMAEAILGSSVQMFLQPIIDFTQAMKLNGQLPAGDKFTNEQIRQAPIDSIIYHARDAKMSTIGGLLWDVQNKASVANSEYSKLKNDAEPVMSQIIKTGQRQLIGQGQFFTNNPNMGVPDTINMMSSLVGDPEFATIFGYTYFLDKAQLRDRQAYTNAVREQDQLERGNPMVGPEDKMTSYNRLQATKSTLITEMLNRVRDAENNISMRLGKPFTYSGYQVPGGS